MKLKNYKTFVTDMVIYGIQNIITSKWYIGSCKNFKLRIRRHYYYLQKQKHHSTKLQRSWDKYGEDAFEVTILKECKNFTSKQLTDEEENFINQYDSYENGYNMTNKCTDYKHFTLTDRQIANFVQKRSKKVVIIDRFTGQKIETVDSIAAASKKYNVSTSNISKVCQGRLNYLKNYVFVYEHDYDDTKNYRKQNHGKGICKSKEQIQLMRKHCNKNKVIYKYDLEYNLIETYISRAEACRQNGFKKDELRYKLNKNINEFIYSEQKCEKDIV